MGENPKEIRNRQFHIDLINDKEILIFQNEKNGKKNSKYLQNKETRPGPTQIT